MMRTPSFSFPTSWSRGTSTSWKASSPVGEPRIPILSRLFATEKPGESLRTRNALMPRGPLSGAVFA